MTDVATAIALAVCFGTFAALRFRWALAVLAFLLPTYQIRFHLGPLPTTALEIMVLTLCLVWFVRFFVAGSLRNVRFPYWKEACAVLLAGLLAAIVSPNSWAGFGLYRAYIVEPILVFFVAVNTLATPRDIRFILFGLGSSVVVVGCVALLQWIGLVPGTPPYIEEIPRRATGVFGFPTAVGKLFAPIASFFCAWLIAGSWKNRAVAWPVSVFVFALLGILVSVSRGAFFSVAVAWVCVALFTRWKRTALLFGVVAILGVLLLPPLRNEAVSIVRGSDVSTDVHLVMWRGTVRLIADRPFFGAGLAGFPLVYGDYKEPSHVEFFPNPDNFVLTVWAELGLLGVAAFVWLFARLFRDSLALLRTSEIEHRTIGLGIFAVLIGILAYGLIDTPYFKNDLAMQFWLFVAILAVVQKTNPATHL